MECKITIDDEYAKKHGIKTAKAFEAFCKEAVSEKLFLKQFGPHNQAAETIGAK